MIRYLKRHEINDNYYDNCIKLSRNSRIYAFSWYLDCVADNWDALVLNDYEAVMPLPWRSKYFIKYMYPPAWTQQLGVFSKNEIPKKLISDFIKKIPKKFKKTTIQFNSQNDLSLFKTQKRTNYILPLNKTYEEIYEGFNKNRKRDLIRSERIAFELDKNIETTEFLSFYLNQSKPYQLNQSQIATLKLLLNSNNKAIHTWGIRKNKELIAGLVWLKDNNRIIYLLPIATKEAKKNGFPTKLVIELIITHQNSNYILDFEGSMILNVANFYKSFGVVKEDYYLYLKKRVI